VLSTLDQVPASEASRLDDLSSAAQEDTHIDRYGRQPVMEGGRQDVKGERSTSSVHENHFKYRPGMRLNP